MAYGAANSLNEVEPYLADIRAGQPPSPELVEEIKNRYKQIGGKSPLLDITKKQAAALEGRLNGGTHRFKVYIGMRHWHPYIKDTVADIARDGFGRIIAICLTPYYSKLSVGVYFQKLDEAIAATGKTFTVHRVESWNDQTKLIEVITEKVNTALNRFPADTRPKVPLLFTAHSLPERILAEKDPYPEEFRETIELVMKRLGP